MTSADWVIFAFDDLSKDPQTLEIYRKLFTNRSDLVRNKKLIGLHSMRRISWMPRIFPS